MESHGGLIDVLLRHREGKSEPAGARGAERISGHSHDAVVAQQEARVDSVGRFAPNRSTDGLDRICARGVN